jgi:general nucleoside transport system ATP-binding protein
VQLRVTKPPASPGEVRLDVQDLTVAGEEGKPAVDAVSFQVRAGEILGVAGVQGNGQTELCEALLGLVPAAAGSVRLEDRDLTRATPKQRLRAGIGYIPEDRQEDGLVAGFSVADNLVLDVYNQPPYSSGIALNLDTIHQTAAERVADFDIRTTSTATHAGTLSGGNQQKVILAREIGRDVRLLVASQPTRGLDVGSIEFVHRRIVEERDQGVAVLIISSELDEIYALSDRIAVMYEGKITGFRDPSVPPEELGMLMAGATDADAAASRHGGGLGEAGAETGLMASGLLGIGVPGTGPPADAAPADAAPTNTAPANTGDGDPAPTDTAPTDTGDGDPAGDGGEPE